MNRSKPGECMTLQRTSIRYRNGICPHYYLCNYLPGSAGKDLLSRSLLKWKQGQVPDLEVWIACSLEALADVPIRPGTIIIRALHHHETILSPGTLMTPVPAETPAPLDLLGKALATHFQADYLPDLLRKSRTTREIKEFSREERIAELQHVYSFADLAQFSSVPRLPPSSRFLLLDDVFTTGTTLKMMISAIRERYPLSSLTAFTLVRSVHNDHRSQRSPEDHHAPPGSAANPLLAEETADLPYSAAELTACILANSF